MFGRHLPGHQAALNQGGFHGAAETLRCDYYGWEKRITDSKSIRLILLTYDKNQPCRIESTGIMELRVHGILSLGYMRS